ncbi:MAG: TIGR04282 family arsenosugar biosynthesis glycosyltransferase [Deltaproteobacteria bacterium]|nr:TIGR04282 family arsenosugar biosynthesis glycosyltransferase [Deltaproteobacteria bacterium]
MKNTRAIAVMAKAPTAGRVKTRLCPFLTEDEAAGFYRALLLDTFDLLKKIPDADVIVAYTPMHAKKEFLGTAPFGAMPLAQAGKTLGERLFNVFACLFEKGYKKAAVIGSDSPDLPSEYIVEAFSALKDGEKKVVLGPAHDGGYYLIAMGRPVPLVFEDIPWGTEKVLNKTMERLKEADVPLSLISPWHDIDMVSDLGLLLQNKRAKKSIEFLEHNRIVERLGHAKKRPVLD